MNLFRQLRELRTAHANYANFELPWADHSAGEPVILPDTGAMDGLCGEKWAMHAGQWAKRHGHTSTFFNLPQKKMSVALALAVNRLKKEL